MIALHQPALPAFLDYAGVAVFAATGALVAARKGYDIVTFAFFAAVTGIGGGALRDLLIGAPVFWVGDAGYVGVCVAVAGLVWAFGARASRFRLLLWLDAVGMAAYSVLGAAKAAAFGVPPLVAVAMGVLTASFGGVVRDVLAGEPSVLLRKEIYVTAALAGAGVFVCLTLAGVAETWATVAGVGVAFVMRAGALSRGWTLPGYGAADTSMVAPLPSDTAVPTTMPTPVAPSVEVVDGTSLPLMEAAPSRPQPDAPVETPPVPLRPVRKRPAKAVAGPSDGAPAPARPRAPRKPKAVPQ